MFQPLHCNLKLAFLAALVFAHSAWAIVTVGPKTSDNPYENCRFRSIQEAIDYVKGYEQSNDPDTVDHYIVVAGGQVYNENLHFDGSGIFNGAQGRIDIFGGFDGFCNLLDGSETLISAGGSKGGSSVLEVSGNSAVYLTNLTMAYAVNVAQGGAINFHGSGELHLAGVDIAGNHADYGAGIFADGANPGLSIFLQQDTRFPFHATLIEDNTARHAGGGLRIQGHTRLFALDPSTQIVDNEAYPPDDDGAGGGLQVLGPARADLGSISFLRNGARVGGGIALIVNSTDKAVVRMFRTNPNAPTLIAHNSATSAGGGIFNTAHSSGDTYVPGLVCAAGTSIDANSAPEGAALYANGDTDFLGLTTIGGYFDFRIGSVEGSGCGPEPASQLGAAGCPAGVACNTINDNRSEDGSGNPTSGATVYITSDGVFQANHTELRRNRGGNVFHGKETGQLGAHLINNCLIAENEVSGDLLHTDELSSITLDNCTIAFNTIAGTNVMSLGYPTLRRSIVWQPGNTVLLLNRGTRAVADVMANEVDSLGGADAGIVVADPQFVAPASGDYHLLQTSPAVDFAASDGVSATALDASKRNVDLPIPNRAGGGPIDLGAYELQTYTAPPPPPPTCVVSDTIFCNGFSE